MTNVQTDYVPGDGPLPVGTSVTYFGSLVHGEYEIVGHTSPEDYPEPLPREIRIAEAYPDGVAYDLWPLDVPKKFGNRHMGVHWARRTSMRWLRPKDKEES